MGYVDKILQESSQRLPKFRTMGWHIYHRCVYNKTCQRTAPSREEIAINPGAFLVAAEVGVLPVVLPVVDVANTSGGQLGASITEP